MKTLTSAEKNGSSTAPSSASGSPWRKAPSVANSSMRSSHSDHALADHAKAIKPDSLIDLSEDVRRAKTKEAEKRLTRVSVLEAFDPLAEAEAIDNLDSSIGDG